MSLKIKTAEHPSGCIIYVLVDTETDEEIVRGDWEYVRDCKKDLITAGV